MSRYFQKFYESFLPAELPPDTELLRGQQTERGTSDEPLTQNGSKKDLEALSETIVVNDDFTQNSGEPNMLEIETEDKINAGLKRKLKSRHIQMIAIGGAIGTGLFVGSGKAFHQGGPASVLLDYCLVGLFILCTVFAMGELSILFPIKGSFTIFISRFIDESLGFALGWNYIVQWLCVFPLELVAAGIVIQYWKSGLNVAIFITIFLLLIAFINLFGVKGYGEVEFACATIKSVAVIVFILIGIVIVCGGTPGNDYLGASTWHNPGAFINGFKGFCSNFVVAAFAFNGTELVALAAAETQNPHVALPKAAKQIVWRIVVFYALSLFVIGLIVPADDQRLLNGSSNYDASASPFVIAANIAGLRVLPDIVNAVILISVVSVGNSAVYASSRALAAIAAKGQAPRIFAYIDRSGRPITAIGVAILFGGLAYIRTAPNGTVIFDWLLALAGLSSLFVWGSVNVAHIRFRLAWKRHGFSLQDLSWYSPLGIIGSCIGATGNFLAVAASLYIAISPINAKFSWNSFFQQFLSFFIILIFFVAHKIYKRGRGFSKINELDIWTGRRNISIEEVRKERFAAQQVYDSLPLWKKIIEVLF